METCTCLNCDNILHTQELRDNFSPEIKRVPTVSALTNKPVCGSFFSHTVVVILDVIFFYLTMTANRLVFYF